MQDLNACTALQVAALRRLTSDPELAGRCDAWLRERGGLGGPRHFLPLLFAELAAAGWMLGHGDFDDLVDDVPSRRSLRWSGLILLLLIAGYFAMLGFLLFQVRSWPWRGGIVLVLALIVAWETFRGRPPPGR